MAIRADWIAADWGTTALRLWAIGAAGEVLAERRSDKGMGRLAPEGFEPALLEIAAAFLSPDRVTEVVICGMAGARQGWIEAPYQDVPCPPAGRDAVTAPTSDPRIRVRILPGVAQAAPPDVMRGEETQIAGLLAGCPGFDGLACLPGTHTKWVRLRDGRIEGFRTAMTGELFALLCDHSVLRHAIGPGWDEAAFAAAVAEAALRPEALSAALFSIRAASLVAGMPGDAGRARLSGLLIGSEIGAMRALWQDRPVAVIGAEEISAHYATALACLGVESRLQLGEDLCLAGLLAARARIREEAR
jgi:2-dehydro-3-deoxygalactonokinase